MKSLIGMSLQCCKLVRFAVAHKPGTATSHPLVDSMESRGGLSPSGLPGPSRNRGSHGGSTNPLMREYPRTQGELRRYKASRETRRNAIIRKVLDSDMSQVAIYNTIADLVDKWAQMDELMEDIELLRSRFGGEPDEESAPDAFRECHAKKFEWMMLDCGVRIGAV